MTPTSHTPAPRGGGWNHDDSRHDRASGAWLGAGFAASIVGAAPPVVAELAHPDSAGAGPARLAWLIETALRDVRTPNTITSTVSHAPERAWALALSSIVAGDTVSAAPEPTVAGSEPIAVAWQVALDTPVPRLNPARRVFPCQHLDATVRQAHSAGGKRAAMYAGALAGARWGASAVPLEGYRRLCRVVDPGSVVRRCVVLARGSDPDVWPEQERPFQGRSDCIARPFSVPHPHDPGLVLANVSHMRADSDVEAVVSLCKIGTTDIPAHISVVDRFEVWLIDTDGANPNLCFVLDEAARMVMRLRGEGKRVLLHCAAGQSRTPAVAAHYAALIGGADVVRALRTIIPAVGGHLDTPELSRAVAALHGITLRNPARELFPEGMPPRRGAVSTPPRGGDFVGPARAK